jgi:hypothetical protein
MAAVQATSSRSATALPRSTPRPELAIGRDATSEEVQNRFLKLLVTQLQNQDPLNPLDNAAVTTQVSQINTVTGIERLNATLETLLNSFNDAGDAGAASDGQERAHRWFAAVSLAGQAVAGVNLAGPADSVKLTISMPRAGWCRVRISVRVRQAASASSGMARAMPGWRCRPATTALRSTRCAVVTRCRRTLQLGTVSALVRGKRVRA